MKGRMQVTETDTRTDTAQGDFIETLRTVNKGQSPFELSQALDKLVAAVKKTGKAGKLVYTLSVAPAANTDGQVGVSDDIDIKLPKPSRFQSIFFATDSGKLTREDPNQMELPDLD